MLSRSRLLVRSAPSSALAAALRPPVGFVQRASMSLVSFHGTEAELEKLVADPGSKVLYFTASWCPPCRMIAPAFQKMSEEFSSIEFIKIDIDDYGDAASGYDVRSVPTFIFMKGPAIKSQFSGANEATLRAHLTTLK